jgi:hypothetical protein
LNEINRTKSKINSAMAFELGFCRPKKGLGEFLSRLREADRKRIEAPNNGQRDKSECKIDGGGEATHVARQRKSVAQ